MQQDSTQIDFNCQNVYFYSQSINYHNVEDFKVINFQVTSLAKYRTPTSENNYIALLVRRCQQGVVQLTYKGVPSCKSPLQASDKYHAFNPAFDQKSFQFDIFPRYILDILAYKGVEIGNSLISEQATPLQARLCTTSIQYQKLIPKNTNYINALLYFVYYQVQYYYSIAHNFCTNFQGNVKSKFA
ncbi:Hypothetical_protein [Hexamita inflata]|uniref:Hypothetical_protein n=1 Tax=Hexamita inflata TaxID=28002 RepID=A0AA86NVX4_9EUKA|nr:Hypothetical protein HINF_LOCUS15222 [Hexamita inflata]